MFNGDQELMTQETWLDIVEEEIDMIAQIMEAI